VQTTLAWFAGLPPAALYLALGVLAALENVFPPLPTDTVVAFGTWVAARGEGSVLLAFFATWFGNVAGAAGMYAAGRRYGTEWIYRRFPSLADARREDRLLRLYARYGIAALVMSRFIPGVRAVVPPVAGALRVPPPSAITAMALASGIWYGFIAYVAYGAGSNWDALSTRIAQSGQLSALAAAALVIAALAWLLVRARRQRSVK
jgi:membrane protein DedA with SNARE-associated domain